MTGAPGAGATGPGATGRTVVIGVGNPFRRDDGVGAAVCAALGPTGDAEIVELDGEPSRMVDAWAGAGLAVVVDAARSGSVPGTWRRIEVGADPVPAAGPAASSHGLGVEAAVALGRALGRLPGRLVVIAVEAADLGEGPGLSPEVAATVDAVVAAVRGELASPRDAGRDEGRDEEQDEGRDEGRDEEEVSRVHRVRG